MLGALLDCNKTIYFEDFEMFGWAQINQVCLVISGPFLVISDVPLGEFKMGFVMGIPHTLAVPLSFLFESSNTVHLLSRS